MFARIARVTLLFVPTILLGLLFFMISGRPAAASPAAQGASPAYQIVITKTVGVEPDVCATTTSITVPFNSVVYACVTVQNTGSLTLTRHTLRDSHLGVHTFEALLPPGAVLNTLDQGLTLSSSAAITATGVVTWTAQPYGYEEATATASATVYVMPPADRITVNTTDDAINNNGDCSLREAIIAANTDSPVDGCASGHGADAIFVPAGTYDMTLQKGPYGWIDDDLEDASASGDFDLLTPMVIQGEGKDATVIDGPYYDRVFHILSGAEVTLAGLTIQGGHNTLRGGGGGIRNEGNLTLQDSRVVGNRAGDETGFTYNYGGGGILNNGTLTITRSEIRANSAGSTSIGSDWYFNNGGGIANLGTLTITESLVANNSGGDGGGLSNNGTAYIANSQIAGNDSYGQGAGILNWGELVVYDTDIERNSASCAYPASCGGGGGGLFNGGGATATIERSRIGHNSNYNRRDSWEPQWGASEGGGILNTGAITLSQTAVYSNAAVGRQPVGGGLSNMDGHAFIYNSTFSGNAARGEDTTDPRGGGIYNQSQMSVQDSTVAYNRVNCPEGTCSNGRGGGIANENSGTITLTNSLVAGNWVEGNAVSPDCAEKVVSGGVIISGGSVLIGDASGCTLTGETTGNLTDVDAQLAPLAESSTQDGETTTFIHALRPGSPAIDAGHACLQDDQRGVSRPQDGNGDGTAACDIGAYELCTQEGDPLCVAITSPDGTGTTDGTTDGAGDPAEVEEPDAGAHQLHLPLLQSDAGN